VQATDAAPQPVIARQASVFALTCENVTGLISMEG
jgi:hypothetical protein